MKKNHRMRQILCILTTITVAWSFAACGASSGGSKTESMMQNSASYAYDAAYEEETGITEEAMSADTTSNKLDSGTGENGAVTLTNIVSALFGRPGGILLAAIFMIACFNTCTGLLSCCSEYFNELFPRISYRLWVAFFAALSMLVSNVGLTQILAISVPILNAIYPAALTLILLALAGKRLAKLPYVYPLTVGLVCVESITAALSQIHVIIPGLTAACAAIPLAKQGLGWLLPALVGLAAGIALSLLLPKKETADQT